MQQSNLLNHAHFARRLGPQTTGGGYASITKKNDPISRLTLPIRYPDTFETLCPEGKCMITAPFGQCDVFDKKCIYFWTIEGEETETFICYSHFLGFS